MFCGLFELYGVSPWFRIVHGFIMSTCRVLFLYMGNVLQFLALLNVSSLAEIPIIVAVGVCYFNIAIKAAVFAFKGRDIEKLWNRFGDADFRAKSSNEFRWAFN